MRSTVLFVALASALMLGTVAVEGRQAPSPGSEVLATVKIAHAVLANGKPLPMGSYELRLTKEQPPTPQAGQSPGAQRWVEFVANGLVAGREIAEVLQDSDRPAVGASAVPAADGAQVELLKGGEFVRVSVKRNGVRYLVHLPVAP